MEKEESTAKHWRVSHVSFPVSDSYKYCIGD